MLAGLPEWEDLDPARPPLVPLGTGVVFRITWINQGSANMRGHLELTITRPDGTLVKLGATENQDKVSPPNGGWTVQFEAVTLDQVGNYQGRAVLSGEVA